LGICGVSTWFAQFSECSSAGPALVNLHIFIKTSFQYSLWLQYMQLDR